MNKQELIHKSNAVMQQVEQEIGQSIGLLGLNRDKMCGVVIAAIDGTAGFAFHMDPDFEFPLHTSAPGKVFLAYQTEQERMNAYRKMDFRRFTPNTIVSAAALEIELEQVRTQGYGVDLNEEREGCHCIGVPIFDASGNVISSLWTSAPSSQLPPALFPKIAEVLHKGALEISRRTSNDHHAGPTDQIITEAKEMLTTRQNQAIDVKAIAASLNVSYSWFRRAFKAQTGEAPSDFHQRLRFEAACRLLRETDWTVKQIAAELGFQDQNYFSALFKRKIGLSPKAYRTCPPPS